MPAVVGDVPAAVALSFANNFWGKDDAGVGPLLVRMNTAKQTCDELKAFYTARASIEDEYARRLLSLCKKPLGSQEMGGLKLSLDTVRGEVEAMAKQHQNIAAQMKSELEEPLAAFSGAMKERRKIVQNGIEKLLKTKMQQTQQVNKTRDKFEQESFKIKGYLAQGHMVMGQEERKNKAKLEKTQIALAASNTEYENAVKILEETTARWNREWKTAADKFQDLEEERLDFTKSSLWAFANIASTVCVSDDASCEKIRLSLEKMDVEKDIVTFITERGTGQEIPDPPKYINFIRGDATDSISDADEDENYSVAQFPRSINPAFRSSSPQPSTYESHHEVKAPVSKDIPDNQIEPVSARPSIMQQQPLSPAVDHEIIAQQKSRLVIRQDSQQAPLPAIETVPKPAQEVVPAAVAPPHSQPSGQLQRQAIPSSQAQSSQQQVQPQTQAPSLPRPIDPNPPVTINAASDPETPTVPSYEETLGSQTIVPSWAGDGTPAEAGPNTSTVRPSSRESTVQSDYSNPASFSSMEAPSGSVSPTKQTDPASSGGISDKDKRVMKKRSGFFQSHSPFRRKSTKERDALSQPPYPLVKQLQHQSQQASLSQSPVALPEPPSQASPESITQPATDQRPLPASSHSVTDSLQQSPIRVLSYTGPRKQPPQPQSPASHAAPVVQAPPAPLESSSIAPRNSWNASPNPSQHQNPISYNTAPPVSTGPPPSQLITSRPSKFNSITGNATMALGVGGNLLLVSDGTLIDNHAPPPVKDDGDLLAMALAELKIVTNPKQSSSRVSADRYAGISTPAPGFSANGSLQAAKRGTPPPLYEGQVQRLGAPPPAHTAKAMKEASEKYVGQTRSMFGDGNYSSSSLPRSGTRHGGRGSGHRSMSPAPAHGSSRMSSDDQRTSRRSASPNAPSGHARSNSRVSMHNNSMNKRGGDPNFYNRPGTSHSMRGSPADHFSQSRPSCNHVNGDMAMQLVSPTDPDYGMQLERAGSRPNSRPGTSNSSRAMGFYEGPGQGSGRQRSKSVADPSRQYSRDGRLILHFARAMYAYQAAISEELGFSKGDTLAILRHQDDGWWEAEVHNAGGRVGLVPSNYLQAL